MYFAKRNTQMTNGKRITIRMHQIILERMLKRGLVNGEKTDHINHDGLDNRRENLRLATNQENSHNQRAIENCSSVYKGVSWDKNRKKWRVYIKYKNIKHHVGRFDSEIEAAKAYDQVAIGLFGNFAVLNFPK
jgi:hypothetical protein